MAVNPDPYGSRRVSPTAPRLLATRRDHDIGSLRVRSARSPTARGTLGDVGMAVRVGGGREEAWAAETILVQPFERGSLRGVDPATIRTFRWSERGRRLVPEWSSGVNPGHGWVWTRMRRPGLYVPIGLPRDRLLQEAIRAAATERRLRAGDDGELHREINERVFGALLDLPPEVVAELRELLARIEIQTSAEGMSADVELGPGGHPAGFALPGAASWDELREQLAGLEVPPGGLPEEELFFPPHVPRNEEPPWNRPAGHGAWEGYDWRAYDDLAIWKLLDPSVLHRHVPPWLFSPNWWMYQHDIAHTGHASGLSDITSATVTGMYLHHYVDVDGPIVTKPSIVGGKVYVGSGKSGGVGGTLYKVDLASGAVERTFTTAGSAFYSWVSGIGGSPAVVGNRVYFTGVHGTVYCIDANTFGLVWSVSLKAADPAHNQPVTNPNADSWSGPIVVNGRVYVGCGEGESATTYGFVFCLDAATGNVVWCFCTDKFTGGADNQPNHLPTAVAAPWAGANGFTVLPNPPQTGCSVWSSCAYDRVHNRIYVGTGNSEYPHTAQPDELYGSGLICLDATTGAFEGFFQPSPDDSYWPGDFDIDVPGSATVYSLGTQRVVAFGTKAGSFFVLDAGNVNNVIARRQLLPRTGGSGLPGDRGTGIPAVVPTGGTGENSYGVLGTPAIDPSTGRIFVGLGGYNGMALDAETGIDQTRTPFLRALEWDDLHDAWPTAVGADNVSRYTTTRPPMYLTLEVGLSSPAVVHDVVFVSTSPPPGSSSRGGLYALSVADGHCLWAAPGGLTAGAFSLGPTVYGNYVVVGAGTRLYFFKLGPRWRYPVVPPPLYRRPLPWEPVEERLLDQATPLQEPWLGPGIREEG